MSEMTKLQFLYSFDIDEFMTEKDWQKTGDFYGSSNQDKSKGDSRLPRMGKFIKELISPFNSNSLLWETGSPPSRLKFEEKKKKKTLLMISLI